MHLTITEPPTEQDLSFLKYSLNTYNESFTGILPRERISAFVKDPTGLIFGGIVGEIKWGWLYVEGLWTEDAIRHSNWGTKLLEALEEYAKSKGVVGYRLETTSFQAIDFYIKNGYVKFGELTDFPPGYISYFLKKLA